MQKLFCQPATYWGRLHDDDIPNYSVAFNSMPIFANAIIAHNYAFIEQTESVPLGGEN